MISQIAGGWKVEGPRFSRIVPTQEEAERLHAQLVPIPEKYWLGHMPTPRPITRAEAVRAVHEVYGVGTWLTLLKSARSENGLDMGPRYDCQTLFARME